MEGQLTPGNKGKSGCWKFLLWLIAGVAGMLLLDYLLTWIFAKAYPPDELSRALVPFQNHFHALTANFITSEELTNEFSNDVGATARMITYGIVAIAGSFGISAIIYMIPPAKKLMDNIVYILFLPAFILALAYSLFFPSIKTVFDRENKEVIVTKHAWIFFPGNERIPFAKITNIDYKIFDDGGHYGDTSHNVFTLLYAYVGDRKIFIGENQMPSHSASEKDWKNHLDSSQAENATQAIRKIVGLN